MAAKRLYAEGTSVQPERSRMEIEQTLARYGASAFSFGHDSERGLAVVMFRAHDRHVRFQLTLPTDPDAGQFKYTRGGAWRDRSQRENAMQAEIRRLWRAFALSIKAKLEAVESGIVTFEQEFLAHIVLADGSTVGDWAAPQLEQTYATGQMPGVLPGTDARALPRGQGGP